MMDITDATFDEKQNLLSVTVRFGGRLQKMEPARKKAKWIEKEDFYTTSVCSNCGYEDISINGMRRVKFCPRCGAFMEGWIET